MGKGGRANITSKITKGVWKSAYDPLDSNAPKLPTKGEIKSVIPKECFKRSYTHSMWFVFRDTAMAAILVWMTSTVLSATLPTEVLSVEGFKWCLGWNLYAFWMGTVLTGHWVLAHECGHGAFSPSQTFNDVVGFILHQALLVPYFAWQFSHAKHHRRTNHLTDGESHVPTTAEEYGLISGKRTGNYSALHEAMGDGAFAAFQVFSHVVLGWPLYLLGLASTGRLAYDGTSLKEGDIMDHFRPNSKMFPKKIGWKICLSTITTMLSLVFLVSLSTRYGSLSVCLWYIAPYMWTNFWLVTYTWLQHTDPSIPQYGPEKWTWVKGALSTVDRPYGIFCFFHHKIGSTHVAHHLFHEMPFYKADEATAAIKAFLEPQGLYNYDPTPWYIAMWKIANTCHYVDDICEIQYFKSFNDAPLSFPKKKKS